ncbi:MAG: hypothetical protein U0T77_03950 [Chitinophagales bacterium]
MKKPAFLTYIFLSILMTLVVPTKAQNSLPPGTITVFSEDGDKFTLSVAGVQQNNAPATQVVAKDVTGGMVPVSIVFENSTIPKLSKNIMRLGQDGIYSIRKDKKGNYSLKLSNAGAAFVSPQQPTDYTNYSSDKVDAAIDKTVTVPDNITTPVAPTAAGSSATIITKESGNVLINGQPADVKVSTNTTGTSVVTAANNTGYITIDPSKKLKEPEITFGGTPDKKGITADELGDGLSKTGDGISNLFSGQQTASKPAPTPAPATPKPVSGTFTFYNDDDLKFTVFLNGVQVNAAPLTNVKVDNITGGSVQARIKFEKTALAEVKKNLIRMGRDCVYTLKKNKKGIYEIKLKSASGSLDGN